MTEGARGWTRRSRHLKTAGTPTRRGAARSGPARAAGAGAGGSGRRTEPTEARTACPCSGAINATSGERAWTLSTPGGPRRPAAVPGVAARRCCRLGRGSQAASARVCAGCSRPVSAPSGTTAQPSTPGRCQTPCRPPVAKSSPPCARPPEAAPPSPQPAQLRRPHPPAGGWESGSGWCSRSPGAGAERGGGSHDPKAVHLPPPPPLPHLRAWEQRCFVPAANTSSLRLREWGRVGPQPGEKVRGGKGQAPAPRWARAHH